MNDLEQNTHTHILIVEDEFFSSKFLEDILNERGYTNIHISSNANEALNVVKIIKFDIVFMDINIDGGMDGIQCAKEINNFYFVPIIYITAYEDTDTIDDAGDTNIFGYIVKPFDKKDIEIALTILKKQLKLTNSIEQKIYKEKVIISKNYEFDINTNRLLFTNKVINLTKKESDVLKILCLSINTNVSYKTFKTQVWNNKDITDSTIRDTILRVRKKVPALNIQSNIGSGYTLIKG